jgi:hypothetical protein
MAQLGADVNGPPPDLISVDDAVSEFGVSRRTLFRLISAERLATYRRAGDRKSYISREELAGALSFKRKLGDAPSIENPKSPIENR